MFECSANTGDGRQTTLAVPWPDGDTVGNNVQVGGQAVFYVRGKDPTDLTLLPSQMVVTLLP